MVTALSVSGHCGTWLQTHRSSHHLPQRGLRAGSASVGASGGVLSMFGTGLGVRRGWVWGSELNLTLGRTCLPQRPGLLRSFLLPRPARPGRGPSPGLGLISAGAWVLPFTCHSLCLLSARFPREPGPSGLHCVLRNTCSPLCSAGSGAPGLPPPSSILSQQCPVDEFPRQGGGQVVWDKPWAWAPGTEVQGLTSQQRVFSPHPGLGASASDSRHSPTRRKAEEGLWEAVGMGPACSRCPGSQQDLEGLSNIYVLPRRTLLCPTEPRPGS